MWDLDINSLYFHSLILGKDETLEVFENILKTGKILSINKSGYDRNNLRMNTNDEICLSRIDNLAIGYSAYDLFVKKKLSLIIKGNLPGVYSPRLVSEEKSMEYISSGFTDLEGEFRVKDEISLDHVVGLNLPVGFMLSSMFGYKYFFCSGEEFRRMKFVSGKNRYDDVVRFYEEINLVMERNNIALPIYDIENKVKINSPLDIEKIKKKI